jgi:cell division protein FtsI/penicillin-binding protein 2
VGVEREKKEDVVGMRGEEKGRGKKKEKKGKEKKEREKREEGRKKGKNIKLSIFGSYDLQFILTILLLNNKNKM